MIDHSAITALITGNGARKYGTGMPNNPFVYSENEYARRDQNSKIIQMLDEKIKMIMEPRFITPPPTSEFIAAISTLIDARNILELGSLTGFTTMHLIKSIIGKEGAKVTSIDCNPEWDKEFFSQPEISKWVSFIKGWTPEALAQLHGQKFDMVFIDTDHSVEHSKKELDALMPITDKGTIFLFHDVPEWQTPENRTPPPIRTWLLEQVDNKLFYGFVLPSCEQQDAVLTWGKGYPRQCNPGIGVFVRR